MTNKERIIEFMKGKPEVSWKEMYAGLPEIKPHVIRATVYLNKGVDFIKQDRGVWKIREETIAL